MKRRGLRRPVLDTREGYRQSASRVGVGPHALKKKSASLSHVDSQGRVKMVDVGDKAVTDREAVARGSISMSAAARRLIRSGAVKKGLNRYPVVRHAVDQAIPEYKQLSFGWVVEFGNWPASFGEGT